MITRNVIEFTDEPGNSPFARWFAGIDAQAAAKVSIAIYRLGLGNMSNTKLIGQGVLEYKLDYGPGYRIYFGQDGKTLVILLHGGTKKLQDKDIKRARRFWTEYKQRKN